MPRKSTATKKDAPPPTTAAALGSLLKSARDIMRKDKGLNGDLDRLPLLTWIMFLKFLGDLETEREEEAALAGKKFRAAIDPPYRWRDWAQNQQGITGDELLAFINQDEAIRPDGKRGPGLFAYLRSLTSSNGDDRRDVIATVFRGVDNRMKSGYLLRDVINKVASIHFTSSEELHTLGSLYESMLREMRDAAGDSGEFYTPRPVVRFMVAVTDPRLGETVLDPAAGTGGFLVEAFNHLSAQVKTVGDRRLLQERTLFGFEPKSLPYLLGQMNLLLHGLDAPRIDADNALRFKLSEIGERDRVDVILTNPPFGGEEEKGIQGNFPEDRQTSETALLFLQLIMRKLHRQPTLAGRYARAAVVVPNGTLFGDGVCARIKQELLKEFNLYTIVRLPNGVFAPYTSIPTNILFFDRSGPTKKVWYYEHPLPEGRKNYTKTAPIQFEEFAPCIAWWEEARGERAGMEGAGCRAARKQLQSRSEEPAGEGRHHAPAPRGACREHPRKGGSHCGDYEKHSEAPGAAPGMTKTWPTVRLGQVLTERVEVPTPDDLALGRVKIVSKISFNTGRIELRTGSETNTEMILAYPGDLLISGINAAKGAIAIYDASETAPVAATIHYAAYEIKREQADVRFLWWMLRSHFFQGLLLEYVPGGIKTELKAKRLLRVPIPLPPLAEQRRIVAQIEGLAAQIDEARTLHADANEGTQALENSVAETVFKGLLSKGVKAVAFETVCKHITVGHVSSMRHAYRETGVPFLR